MPRCSSRVEMVAHDDGGRCAFSRARRISAESEMRQILIIGLSYGITPILMALTILLAWWLAKRGENDEQGGTQ